MEELGCDSSPVPHLRPLSLQSLPCLLYFTYVPSCLTPFSFSLPHFPNWFPLYPQCLISDPLALHPYHYTIHRATILLSPFPSPRAPYMSTLFSVPHLCPLPLPLYPPSYISTHTHPLSLRDPLPTATVPSLLTCLCWQCSSRPPQDQCSITSTPQHSATLLHQHTGKQVHTSATNGTICLGKIGRAADSPKLCKKT